MYRTGVDDLVDALSLAGLFAYPLGALTWAFSSRMRRRWRRTVGPWLTWIAATVFCLVLPMMGCMAGHCAGKFYPFVPLAGAYAAISIGLALRLWLAGRGPESPPSGPGSRDSR